jgi:hypothetical protein
MSDVDRDGEKNGLHNASGGGCFSDLVNEADAAVRQLPDTFQLQRSSPLIHHRSSDAQGTFKVKGFQISPGDIAA